MTAPSQARVHRHPDPKKGRFYQAYFPAWDASLQRWKVISKTTRSTDPVKALEIAQEFERIALASGGPSGTVRLSREQIQQTIDDILRLAGHRPIVHSKAWKEHSEAWLARQQARIPKLLSAGTWAGYKSHVAMFNGWLGEDLDTMPLLNLTGEHLRAWYHAQIEAGRSPNTVNNASVTLSSIFKHAIDEGTATRNPVNLIDRDTTAGNTRDAFTLDQMDVILAHLRKTKDHDWLTVALLGFCTSQRLEDCTNAVRTAFEKSTIPGVGPAWVWTLTQGKTKKVLRIPLVEPLASHIEALLKKPAKSLFLAPSLQQTGPGGWRKNPSYQFAKILDACGIRGRHVAGKGIGRSFNSLTFHSTRHTCNSLLAEAGIPADVRVLITGHGDHRTNLGYTHLTDKTKAKALTKAFKRTGKAA
jgi:integrase